ncbi:MAG: tol-pal system protein YbgF [candidate division Zixibacteria bacterium]|nr:tol-pal system protein YbgF [candidate division Zixibacteria bacterium]
MSLAENYLKAGILVLMLCLLSSGCVSRREIVRFQEQLDYLEESNHHLEKDVASLDSLLKAQLDENQRLKADISSTLGSIDDRLSMLEGRVEESGHRFTELKKQMENREISPQDTSGLPDSLKMRVSLDPQKLYDQAYFDFAKGSYDLAIQGFSDYLRYFPKGRSADQAHYWIAESYYAKKDYERCLDGFQKLLQNFPSSNKLPSALYKIGLCYEELKNQIRANRYFKEVVSRYPDSPEAKLAKEKMGISGAKKR